jgi:CRISPR-associated endonuclease/helicase Cas3
VFGLSNKIVIIDEVHACDSFMLRRLECALAWMRVLRVPVVILSATLAKAQRARLVAAYTGEASVGLGSTSTYPTVTVARPGRAVEVRGADAPREATRRDASVRSPTRGLSVSLHRGLMDDEAGHRTLARCALDATASGGCAALVVNTVSTAQDVFRALHAVMNEQGITNDGVHTTLFHARFPAWRRLELESSVLDRFGPPGSSTRPARAIVVATQVIEQSLDLDFDVMFSELAPIDLLLQRSGRLWRHERQGRTGTPTLHVLAPRSGTWNFGRSERIYARLHLLRTIGLLDARDSSGSSTVTLPDDIPLLVEAVHGEADVVFGSVPADLLAQARQEHEVAVTADRDHAVEFMIGAPEPREFRYPGHRVPMLDPEDEDAGLNALYPQRHKTRLERVPTEAILALTRAEDYQRAEEAWREQKRLDRGTLRALLSTRVSVPQYMLEGVPEAGPPVRGLRVLDLRGGRAGGILYDDVHGISYARRAEREVADRSAAVPPH